jgi:hypothetical protein
MLNLLSVAMQKRVPDVVHVFLTGELPSFSNFYMEQLSDLFLLKKASFIIERCPRLSIKEIREIQRQTVVRQQCSDANDFWWIGDDDIVFEPNFLDSILGVLHCSSYGWAVGTKTDINNRRGYPDFKVVSPERPVNGCSTHYIYPACSNIDSVRCSIMDTGGCLIRRDSYAIASFLMGANGLNTGGEDTLYGLQLEAHGIHGMFVPAAVSYHLEKPRVRFDEMDSRADVIAKVAVNHNLPTESLHGTLRWLNWATIIEREKKSREDF